MAGPPRADDRISSKAGSMNAQTLSLILVAVTMSAAAQILFKIGLTGPAPVASGVIGALLTPAIAGGLALYGVGTLVWLAALSRVEVSQAYPFVGLGFVLTALFGHYLFGDRLSLHRVAGVLLVILGIVVIART
jgi:multidrug transporter EmrE-like cation transporter